MNSEYYKDYIKQKKRQEEKQKMKNEEKVPKPFPVPSQNVVDTKGGKPEENTACQETISGSSKKDEANKLSDQTEQFESPEVKRVVTFDIPQEASAKENEKNSKESKVEHSSRATDDKVTEELDPSKSQFPKNPRQYSFCFQETLRLNCSKRDWNRRKKLWRQF